MKRCPEHHESPEVRISGTRIEMKCCCEPFMATLRKTLEALMSEAAKDEIETQFRKHLH